MFAPLRRFLRLHTLTRQKGLREYRLQDFAAEKPGNAAFEQLWDMPLTPLDQPNRKESGFSQVFLWKAERGNLIVKRQSDYFSRTLLHPLRGIPTLQREFENLLLLERKGIAVPRPLYFGCRRKDGHTQAVLITEYANDFISLNTLLSQWALKTPSCSFRKEIIAAAASAIRKLHQVRFCHRHLVPKHILLKPDSAPIRVILIDLEAAEPFRPFRKNRQADLASLNNRCRFVSQTDKLRFLFSYLEISKWTPSAKHFAREILRKTYQKSRSSLQKSTNRMSCV